MVPDRSRFGGDAERRAAGGYDAAVPDPGHPSDDPDQHATPLDVDVEALMAEVRQTVERKRAEGVYSEEFLALLREPLDLQPDPAFVAGPAWSEVERTATIDSTLPAESRRPVVGGTIGATKRAAQWALRWYLPPLMERVSAHNRAVVAVLAEHNRQINDMQRSLDRLRQLVEPPEDAPPPG
jgi:hypothetical protein